MSIGRKRLIELLAGLTGPPSTHRARSADEVTDLLKSLSDVEALVVSYTLLCLVLDEKDPVNQEAQLHALAELAESDLVPAFVLDGVGGLSRDVLAGSSLEHYDYLTSRQP